MAKDAPGRIPTLDGLRAISILAVMLGHALGTRNLPAPSYTEYLPLGAFGVRVFFVISGFLITTLLLNERARTGTVSVPAFWVRRVYRIFPAFYALFAVVVGLHLAGVLELHRGDALHAATYTMNFHHDEAWWLSHMWSLSVEEQFYLLWPGLMLLTGARGALWAAIVSILAAPVARAGIYVLWPAQRGAIAHMFPTVFDAIAAGCLLACVRDRLWAMPWWRNWLASPAFWLAPLAVLGANALAQWPSISLTVGESVMNLGIAITVERCVRFADGRVGRLLELRPLVWIGSLSYSLYLWQQLFLHNDLRDWPRSFPLNVGLAFAAASASYYLVERPVLRWQKRRMRVRPAS